MSSQYPQINPRISQEQKNWLDHYEKVTGRKGTELMKYMLEALIISCGSYHLPKYPFNFTVNCLTESQLPAVAEDPSTYHASKSTAAKTPLKGKRSPAA